MNLALAHEKLGWPEPDTVLKPRGSGPAMFADKARTKIGLSLKRAYAQERFRIGILHADSNTTDSQPPLAVVCEFSTAPSASTLTETHRLAWNFCHAPLLVTLEPGMIRIWNCGHEPPRQSNDLFVNEDAVVFSRSDSQLDDEAVRLLHWVSLATGQFIRERIPAAKIKPEQRADRSLLENLRRVRSKLRELKMPVDICHDLLARVIFVQFLWDRRDANGDAALCPDQLARWHERNILKHKHDSIGSVLRHRDDAYALFRELDRIFNGDLFPGKESASAAVRTAAWRREQRFVQKEHLDWLARLVEGKDDSKTGQFWLWRMYSFDTIPLEFISSIYEEFVTRDEVGDGAARDDGVVYTPGRVADYVLDQVLPWHGIAWRMRIFDPACGSGIFLVKAFQRLVHRWRRANRGRPVVASILRQILERNLLGVDKNAHAIHVASFSLYLAMLDELEPKDYLERVRFPSLRNSRLISSDFFTEDWRKDFRPRNLKFDIVIGNAPWGDKTATPVSISWAEKEEWSIADHNIGPLFLPSAVQFLARNGRVAMLQPAMTLLFNRAETANGFRRRFFSEFNVHKVVNFAPVRFILFGKRAISPACLIVFDGGSPASDERDEPRIEYATVKPRQTSEDNYALTIEPFDIHLISPKEAANDPLVWTTLSWGGRRDLSLLRSLSHFPSIAKLKADKKVKTREGVNRGDRKKVQKQIVGWRMLEGTEFPPNSFPRLSSRKLPVNDDPLTDGRASTDFSAFERPQLLIKGGWKTDESRFQASLVDYEKSDEIGVLCSQSYITVSDPNAVAGQSSILDAATIVLNSKLAVYHLLLTSSRFASYRPEPLVADFLNVPLPPIKGDALDYVRKPADCDVLVRNGFELAREDWGLVEDLFDYTLPDFKGDATSPGRRRTTRKDEPQLSKYFEFFSAVLLEAFGPDKRITATIYQELPGEELLGLRLVAIELGATGTREDISVRPLNTPRLLAEIAEVQSRESERAKNSWLSGAIVRLYGSSGTGRNKTPTIFLLKPDQHRYWTRSMAMRDADEVAADFLTGIVEGS
ncbi:MAG: N-6 DNA methylase [Verrucomicrobia bacterium]|nr:N-6 DNA methylase [Verrucomicrobiota bacterium]